MGARVENIDIQAATDHRIIVANSPAVTIAVAEAAEFVNDDSDKALNDHDRCG